MRYFTIEALNLIVDSVYPRRDLRFRAARPSDLSALHGNCHGDRPFSQFRESFERSLRRQSAGTGIHLIVEKDGDIVGSGQLVGYRQQKKAEIADLSVATAHRGTGIGKALIHVLTKVAEHAAYPHLEIGVMAGNTRARALYQRLGFRQVEEIPLPGDARALILRKDVHRADSPENDAGNGNGNENDR